MLTERQQAIATKAKEMLAEKISDFVRELSEKVNKDMDISLDDEEMIESEISDIFEYWKDEIEDAAKQELGGLDDIHHAIWAGFNHMSYCIETAKEAAEIIKEENS